MPILSLELTPLYIEKEKAPLPANYARKWGAVAGCRRFSDS
jgi:hypothetical protein